MANSKFIPRKLTTQTLFKRSLLVSALLLALIGLTLVPTKPSQGAPAVSRAGESIDCCDVWTACGLVANGIYNNCMSVPGNTDTYCKRQKQLAFEGCMDGNDGICQPGCFDYRSGLFLPCPGDTSTCTWR